MIDDNIYIFVVHSFSYAHCFEIDFVNVIKSMYHSSHSSHSGNVIYKITNKQNVYKIVHTW